MAVSSDILLDDKPSTSLRIAVASPAATAETFIQAHIDHLSTVELVLSDGEVPTRSSDGSVLVKEGIARGLDLAMGTFLKRNGQGLIARRIAKLLKEHRIDVVLAEYGNTAEVMIDACATAGVPMVAHFHGIDAHGIEYHSRFNGYDRLFKYASRLVVVSRAMEQRLLALGAPREKVIFNCYGVDVDLFKGGDPANAPPHFAGVGRFVEKKAPHLTILAFHKLLQKVPDARLTLIGNGRLWEACHQMIKSLDIVDRVDLPGPKDPLFIADLMRRSRALVQHSVVTFNGDSEGTPLAVLEAMATGIPVIATRHAGILDAVEHEVHGLLCDPFNVDEMAAHMHRSASNASEAGSMGASGRARVQAHYEVGMQVSRLQQVLIDAAGHAG